MKTSTDTNSTAKAKTRGRKSARAVVKQPQRVLSKAMSCTLVLLLAFTLLPMASLQVFAEELSAADQRSKSLDLLQEAYDDLKAAYITPENSTAAWPNGDPQADLDELEAMHEAITALEEDYADKRLTGYAWGEGVDVEATLASLNDNYGDYITEIDSYMSESEKLWKAQAQTVDDIAPSATSDFVAALNSSLAGIVESVSGTYKPIAILPGTDYSYAPRSEVTKYLNAYADYKQNGLSLDALNIPGYSSTIDSAKAQWYAEAVADGAFSGLLQTYLSTRMPTLIVASSGSITGYSNTLTNGTSSTASALNTAYDTLEGNITAAETAASGAAGKVASAKSTLTGNQSTLKDIIDTALTEVGRIRAQVKGAMDSAEVTSETLLSFAKDGQPKTIELSLDSHLPQTIDDNADFTQFTWDTPTITLGEGVSSEPALLRATIQNNVLTLTVGDTLGTATVTVGATFTQTGSYTDVEITPLKFDVEVINTIVFQESFLVASADSTSARTIALPTLLNKPEGAGITYAIEGDVSSREAYDRISVSGAGNIEVAQDTNADTYTFTVVATDTKGHTAQVAVTLTVTNEYDTQYLTWRAELVDIQEQIDTLLAALENLPESTTIQTSILALGLTRTTVDGFVATYDSAWNNGKPQTLLTKTSLSKQQAVEGYELLGAEIPSPLKTTYEGVITIWSEYEKQLAPISALLSTFNDLSDHVTNTDYTKLTSLDSINNYIQKLNAKYAALDDALKKFEESDSLATQVVEGVLAGSKDMLADAVAALELAGIQDQIAAQIEANLTNAELAGFATGLLSDGLDGLNGWISSTISGLPEVTLADVVSWSGSVRGALAKVAAASALIVAARDLTADFDISKYTLSRLDMLDNYLDSIYDDYLAKVADAVGDDGDPELAADLKARIESLRARVLASSTWDEVAEVYTEVVGIWNTVNRLRDYFESGRAEIDYEQARTDLIGYLEGLRDHALKAADDLKDKALDQAEEYLREQYQQLADRLQTMINTLKTTATNELNEVLDKIKTELKLLAPIIKSLIGVYETAQEVWNRVQATITCIEHIYDGIANYDWATKRAELISHLIGLRDYIDAYIDTGAAELRGKVEALLEKLKNSIDLPDKEDITAFVDDIQEELDKLWTRAIERAEDTAQAISAAIRAIPNPAIVRTDEGNLTTIDPTATFAEERYTNVLDTLTRRINRWLGWHDVSEQIDVNWLPVSDADLPAGFSFAESDGMLTVEASLFKWTERDVDDYGARTDTRSYDIALRLTTGIPELDTLLNKLFGIDSLAKRSFPITLDLVNIPLVATVDVNDKDYDRTTNATANTNTIAFAGLVGGDLVLIDPDDPALTVAFNDAAAGVGKETKFTGDITEVILTGENAAKYTLAEIITGSATIHKAEIVLPVSNPLEPTTYPLSRLFTIEYGSEVPGVEAVSAALLENLRNYINANYPGIDPDELKLSITVVLEEGSEAAGSYLYTVTVTYDNVNFDIQNIDLVQALLTIDTRPLTITAASADKVYDGTALTTDTYTVSATPGLREGDRLIATVFGTQTAVGTSASTITDHQILRGATDVTKSYAVSYEDGTLTVNAAVTGEDPTTESPASPVVTPLGTGSPNAPVEGAPEPEADPPAPTPFLPPGNTGVTENTPAQNIPEVSIPLAAPESTATWSVFDLAATILSILALAVLMLRVFLRRRGEASSTRNGSDGLRIPLLICAVAAPVAAVILFVLVQDMSGEPVVFGTFSIAFAALAVLSIVAACTAIRSQGNKTEGGRQDRMQVPLNG
jgi:hypothetical protein